ncbi:4-hydroxythreonine-4-phosphate dehydrogenase PdxA [Brucepastera parasyntrophica]|uniref:4-hydroxythreonine-4-phosphate dehydrogenase PdxA n=1 Tax=Brucepastera parasyntrophica TaxID=2880008 RepID=UPI00210D534A|nr:4-hydroxythreonine-4-phosphate dehydrogenase PdxA [Brucepastera parasyntrophica]ULQ58925.1 4-hydroxythreonine-4-phosphate dehydrogenase PdxA [Brucepastera parasyntrophica]
MNHTYKPRIGVTTGDPAGIGPEIVIKTLVRQEISDICEPVIFGLSSPEHIRKAGVIPGKISAEGGRLAFASISSAVEAALAGDIDALVTAPIHKESLRAAGVPFIGHTEILAELTNSEDPLTMFETRSLRVFFLSRHVSLRQACDLVTEDRVYSYLFKCADAMDKTLGMPDPFIAVAGLNPHCGEHGLFGNEETFITSAVTRASRDGIHVEGPVGADSVFHFAKEGRYDAVLALYHDQGHIACKTLDFERTVSLTLGLPFLRTSVDHGTAFDIAGKGIASETSMMEAIRIAVKYCRKNAGGD